MRRCEYIERKTPSKDIFEFHKQFSSRSHHKLFFGPPCIIFGIMFKNSIYKLVLGLFKMIYENMTCLGHWKQKVCPRKGWKCPWGQGRHGSRPVSDARPWGHTPKQYIILFIVVKNLNNRWHYLFKHYYFLYSIIHLNLCFYNLDKLLSMYCTMYIHSISSDIWYSVFILGHN